MAELEVLGEDQQRINKFGNLNAQCNAIKLDLEEIQQKKEHFQDASEEVLLLDGDAEYIPYQIGTSFFELPYDDANSALEKDQAEINEKVSQLQGEIATREEEMKQLRNVLYAKFGQERINLG
jgi:prefoldin subunit 4